MPFLHMKERSSQVRLYLGVLPAYRDEAHSRTLVSGISYTIKLCQFLLKQNS